MKKISPILLISSFLFLGMPISGCKNTNQSKSQPSKTNIIYILADDLGYGDLSITGQQKFRTPNIDRLAEGGKLFTHHYAGSTVCAPSRSALMTGLHTGHTFIRGNKKVPPVSQYPLKASVETLAEHLQSAGYVTGAFGKWGLGQTGSEGDPNQQGFHEFYGYNSQTLAHNYYPRYLWHNQEKILLEENRGQKTGAYAPQLIHRQALTFLENNQDTSFFMFYPSVIPHAELVAPEKYMEIYRGKFLPEKSYEGTDDGEKFRKGPYGSQPECHAAFAAMIHLLDEQVGEIMEKLEELGIADQTLVIFSSDNGPHVEGGADPEFFDSNGRHKGYKRDLYEGGIRVPMIAHWPEKIKASSTSSHISAFWDVFPTLCDLTGLEKPEGLDGISFLPELLGDQQPKHEYLYWEFHEQAGKQAVRWGKWKGIRLDMGNLPEAPIELYDLEEDPGEEHNLAAVKPGIVAKMDSMMSAAHVESEVFAFDYERE